jgi:hypothetical protein
VQLRAREPMKLGIERRKEIFRGGGRRGLTTCY